MKRARRVQTVVLWGTLALGVGLAAQQPVSLGVVREDGLMIPVAIHDGREWWNAWPFSHESDQSVATLPVPPSLAEIPSAWLPTGVRLPTAWTMYPRRGRARALRLESLARPDGFSLMAFIGIRTSLPRSEIADPANEVGVAISGPATLTSVESMDPASAEYRTLMAAVLPHLNNAESRAIADATKQNQVAPGPSPRSSTALIDPGVLKSRNARSGETVYYVTALRDYGPRPYPHCDLTVSMSAFVVRTARGTLDVRSAGAVTPLECGRDFIGNSDFEVLAVLNWRGPLLWIVRFRAEDGFSYGLLDPFAAGPMELPMKGRWELRPR